MHASAQQWPSSRCVIITLIAITLCNGVYHANKQDIFVLGSSTAYTYCRFIRLMFWATAESLPKAAGSDRYVYDRGIAYIVHILGNLASTCYLQHECFLIPTHPVLDCKLEKSVCPERLKHPASRTFSLNPFKLLWYLVRD